MAQNLTVALEGTNSDIEVSFGGDDNASYELLPGAASVDDPGGSAPSTQSQNFKQEFQSTGGIPPADVTVELDPFVGIHPTIQKLYDAAANKTSTWLRWTTAKESLLDAEAAKRTAAIATTGVVTFAGTDGEDAQKARWTTETFSVGLALLIAGKLYPVSDIAADGAITVVDGETYAAPTQAVAATAYAIVRPGTRKKALCRIGQLSVSTPNDGHVTGSVVFRPKTPVVKPEPVYTV